MIRIKSEFYFSFMVISILLGTDLSAQSSSWDIKNRLQCGMEYDSNIRESRTASQAEPSLRMLFQTRGERKSAQFHIGFDYSAGYQAYAPQAKEDKLINEGNLRLERKIAKRLIIGVDSWGRLKLFLYNAIDYFMITSRLYSRIDLPHDAEFHFYIRPQLLDYRRSSYFDFNGYEYGLTVNKNLSRQFSVEFGLVFNKLTFDRQAIDRPLAENFILVLEENQLDKIQRYFIKLQYVRRIYASIGYFAEQDVSNSYGFSFQNQWIMLSLSKKLSPEILLRLYAMMQKKKYRETYGSFIPLELDSEREDSNFIICDLSRTLLENLSMFLRLALFHNESPYRSQYYQKHVVTLGLDYRF